MKGALGGGGPRSGGFAERNFQRKAGPDIGTPAIGLRLLSVFVPLTMSTRILSTSMKQLGSKHRAVRLLRRNAQNATPNSATARLWVGGIPFGATQQHLRDEFSKVGQARSASGRPVFAAERR